MDVASLGMGLTPHGHLFLTHDADAPRLDERLHDRLRRAFASDELELIFRKRSNKGTPISYLAKEVFTGIKRLAKKPATSQEFDQLVTEKA